MPDLGALLAGVGACVGAYAALRAELVRATVKAEQAAQDAVEAHRRIDLHIENHHTTKGA